MRARILLTILAVLGLTACSSPTNMKEQLVTQGCSVNAPDPRACDPADTQKTTICHIPPGNPANAHTICVGNAAVPAHLDNHGDFVGTCSCTSDDGGVIVPDDGGVGDGGGGGGSDDAGVIL